jgi:hypothetical protein
MDQQRGDKLNQQFVDLERYGVEFIVQIAVFSLEWERMPINRVLSELASSVRLSPKNLF